MVLMPVSLYRGSHSDGSKMAKDVLRAFEGLYQAHAGMTPADAKAAVSKLMQERRYVQDIWS